MRAGEPYPLGATFDGQGTNFSVFSRVAERVELCLFDDHGRESARGPARDDRPQLARLPARRGTRAALRLPRPRTLGPGHRAALQSPQAAPRPLRPRHRRRHRLGAGHLRPRRRRARRGAARSTALRSCRARSSSATASTGAAMCDPASRTATRSSTRSTSRASRCATRTFRRPSAGTYAGLAHPAAIEHLRSLGVTSVELLPIHHFLHDGFLLQRGLRNYWGYNSIGYFAPHAEYAAAGSRWRAGRRVQGHGQGAPRGRPGGHPRRRLQPHRRRRRTTAPRCRCAASTTRPTTGCSAHDPQPLHGLHGHAATR